jgi:hypothetical protein
VRSPAAARPPCSSYATTLNDELGEFHHVARLATRLLGRPSALRLLVTTATRRPAAAGGVLRIATRSMSDDAGAAERLYHAAARAARLAPSGSALGRSHSAARKAPG